MQAATRFHGAPSLSVKLSAGAALVALADAFFYGHRAGWTAGLYAAILLGALCRLHRGFLQPWQNRVTAALLCTLAMALADAPRMLPALLYVLGIMTMLAACRRSPPGDAVQWARDLLRFVHKGLMQWRRDGRLIKTLRAKKKVPEAQFTARAPYALAPAVLSCLFILLFWQANPVIAQVLERIDWDMIAELLSPWRGLFWLVGGVASWALLRPRFSPAARTAAARPVDVSRWFSGNSIVISLALFNALFAVQNALDAVFLWTGRAALPAGVTYAEYAHAGAYPLIVTALLAAGYVLVTFQDGKYSTPAARRLVYLWVAQNIVLVVSAIDRTLNYIAVYSLTYLRVSALVWMGLVAAGLALVILRIFLSRGNLWLVNMNVLALLATLYACCFVNLDRLVADYNVRHACEVTGSGANLDFGYMAELGPDAIPALRWFGQNARYSPAATVQAENLRESLEDALAVSMASDWRGWTWRRQQALDDTLSHPRAPGPPLGDTGWRLEE